MVPRKIHYCWFGRGEMPEMAKKCVDSWHKYLPDYEYKLWNEDNFDVDSTPYTSEAYAARKFAFVTDYVRLLALYNEGGIYLDTDVEVLKPLDDLCHLTAYTGYEGSKRMPLSTCIMASEAHGIWIKEQLDLYEDLHFIRADGSMDLTPNTMRILENMQSKGFNSNGKYQVYKDLHVFPVDYFSPRQTTGEYFLTDNTYCDHHGLGSWMEKGKGWKGRIGQIIGHNYMIRLIKIKRKLFG